MVYVIVPMKHTKAASGPQVGILAPWSMALEDEDTESEEE